MNLTERVISKARYLASILNRHRIRSCLQLEGPYLSYNEAIVKAHGYHDPVILKKVQSAVCEVINNPCGYERDGTVFSHYPKALKIRELLYKYLLRGSLVVDFGGGLGGTFINHRDLFDSSHKCIVVEQPNFVEAGRAIAIRYNFPINFLESLDELHEKPDILIVSAVLQYVNDLDLVLQGLAKLNSKIIILDRTAFIGRGPLKWWLQVENTYYGTPVSYPFRPLELSIILDAFQNYSILDRWTNPFDPQQPAHRGLLLQRNS